MNKKKSPPGQDSLISQLLTLSHCKNSYTYFFSYICTLSKTQSIFFFLPMDSITAETLKDYFFYRLGIQAGVIIQEVQEDTCSVV